MINESIAGKEYLKKTEMGKERARAKVVCNLVMKQYPSYVPLEKTYVNESKSIITGHLTSRDEEVLYSIFEQSVLDLFSNHIARGEKENDRQKACKHLAGDILECSMVGIDADWIRRLLSQAEVSIDSDKVFDEWAVRDAKKKYQADKQIEKRKLRKSA